MDHSIGNDFGRLKPQIPWLPVFVEGVVIVGLILLAFGAQPMEVNAQEPATLQPSEHCIDHSDAAVVTFEDANLEEPVRGALSVDAQDDLTCGLVSGLTRLAAEQAGIESLVGIQNLTSLTFLRLTNNSIIDISAVSGLTSLERLRLSGDSITDISALSGLTSLTFLTLATNSITDISALSGLTSLTDLRLMGNSISDISALSGLTSLTTLYLHTNPDLTNIEPLLANTGLGPGDTVWLSRTNVRCIVLGLPLVLL